MIRESITALAIGQLALCAPANEEATPSGFTCSDYQIMIDVELAILQECDSDSDCDQLLDGGYTDCLDNPPLLNKNLSSEYMYELLEEADTYGCSIALKSNDVCDSSAHAACSSGSCSWVK